MVETTTAGAVLTRERRVSVPRIVAAGCGAAVLAVLIGAAVELLRFGRNDAAAAARVEQDVRAAFADMTADVERLAHAVAGDPAVAKAMASGLETDDGVRTLFDAAAGARAQLADSVPLVAITIYDARGGARGWAGRASDLPRERPAAPLFVAPSPLGLRLVYLDAIVSPSPDRSRLGSVAVEHVLTPVRAGSLLTSPEYVMPTRRAQVQLRLHDPANPPVPAAPAFTVAAPDGTPLVDVVIPPGELSGGRRHLRRYVTLIAVSLVALTILLLAGPLLDARVRAREPWRELRLTAAIVAVVLAGAGLLWLGFLVSPAADAEGHRRAVAVLLGGATAAAVAAALVSAAVRLRVALRAIRRSPEGGWVLFVAAQLACGIVLAALLIAFERLLGRSVDPSQVDLRHFSLHPWTAPRLATLSGVLLGHAAALWAGALACVIALARWRMPRRWSSRHAAAAALWLGPILVIAAIAYRGGWAVPVSAVVLGATACAAAALVAPRLVIWYRRVTAGSRILALFMAFLLPALLVYPSVHFVAERKMRSLIESRYAVEAMSHPQALQARLNEALAEIDALPDLTTLVTSARGAVGGCSTDPAFRIWNQTVLARARLTSDIEIYDGSGTLVSCFALNFPEYNRAAASETLRDCHWEIFGEALLFAGGQERNTLHAQRSVCADGRRIGMIAVHVVFDYRTLPFISSQSAYLDVFSPTGSAPLEGPPAGDVEFTAYGWGLTTIYSSAPDAWPLDDATFARVYRSREPFWTVLEKNDTAYNVYFANDRQFIYALGYPIPGVFDHLVRLAELTTLAAAGYVLALIGTAVFTRLSRVRPQTGRALLREIRASFYRKLFLAFVLASIVPVLTLALVIRTYFAGLLNEGIRAEAARTAAVAQRVIEESDALLRRGGEAAAGTFGSDDVMVWISQLINQDVNVFADAELVATSERDLFASGVLPTRTPDGVYRAIILQRLPSFVTEDQIGAVPYMVAAAPVRTGGATGALTVPLAFRQHEVEREIDELDRGVHLAALFFVLLGAGIGLSMAERIADPVRQLTRATGRIARGDFDARIAVRSSDELRRLVDAFNGMAAELKAQRDQLERTHRLEAWAEMARQVAHEIKNPLTPIQLSAEHLQRVHADRGQPLGPVLEGCVTAILGQVRLLRQIASEFSSFASSPTARRARVDAARLVHDVVEPYRAGLAGRIEIVNEIQAPLPPVLVDRTLVARALANVVENALHAMPGTGSLHITSTVEPGWVSIRVADTGVGMDDEALARVFEPYFSTKTTGTGLGLPIALRNVELSGGHIQVESRRGAGTTVTIRLPVDPSA
ncbi:MAG TPA: HAMP domain-containing sensor histidine kinase [Vicinamibacterales bacterium]|nr:HAMP domain-containing sensor histidine kinase [Vicinamibacterales bacterium]